MLSLKSSKRKFQLVATIFLVVLLFLSTACSKFNEEKISNKLIKEVNAIEEKKHDLNKLKISYAEFKKGTDKYLSDYFKSFYKEGYVIYADKGFVKSYTGREYSEEDWTKLSFEEIKKTGKLLVESLELHYPSYFYENYEYSEIYDDDSDSNINMHYKHIFTKQKHFINSEEIISYNQYTFKREGDNYVLFSIKNIGKYSNKDLIYNNEKVEFIKAIDFE